MGWLLLADGQGPAPSGKFSSDGTRVELAIAIGWLAPIEFERNTIIAAA